MQWLQTIILNPWIVVYKVLLLSGDTNEGGGRGAKNQIFNVDLQTLGI